MTAAFDYDEAGGEAGWAIDAAGRRRLTMNDCCKSKLEELVRRMSDKFGPLIDTADPNTAMTSEQFGMFRTLMWVSGEAEKMARGGE